MNGLKKNTNNSVLSKRELVDSDNKEVSISKQCDLLQLSRSSYYYKPVEKDETEIKNLIDEIYTQYPFYGVRRITDELRYEHDLVVNHKRVHRLMKEMGIQGITPKRKTSISNDSHKKYPYLLNGYEIKAPNEVWMSDITYIRMEKGYMYLVAILDWYSRYVVNWKLSNTMEADFCVESLQKALEAAKPKISNTDQGSQFTSERYTKMLLENEIEISMDGRGRCYDNIWVERLWRSVKYEEVYLHEYRTGEEARERLDKYFIFYNNKRRHQSLDKKPPAEVYFNY